MTIGSLWSSFVDLDGIATVIEWPPDVFASLTACSTLPRARALYVIVGSPALLHARCHTIEQVRLVNNLCRYIEHAEGARTRSR